MREGWVEKKFSECFRLRSGDGLTSKAMVEGVYPVYGGNGIAGMHNEFNLSGDNVVIGRVGALCGIARHITENIWLTDNAFKIVDFKYELANDFLTYLLNYKNLRSLARQAAQPVISNSSLKDLVLNFPVSVAEQKRIVAILDEAFAGIDTAIANTEKNLANARELFESYLNNIFAQKSEGWLTITLGEVGKVSMCKRILKKQTTASGDIPFYKIGTFGKEPNAFISNDIYQDFKKKYSFPKKGDVLISASGTIGRRVIYDGMPAYFQDSNIVWIDNDEELVLNEYLYHYYGVCDWNPSKGTTISRLYNDDLRRIKISFPSIVDQKKLIETMVELNSQTQNLEAIYQNKLSALVELKQSLLQKAFSGELTAEGDKLMDEAVA